MEGIPAFDSGSGALHVIVETPKGSRNKFDYDPAFDVFRLAGVLPAGAVFPFDFGFVPSTLGEDGDPLDVLLLMESSVAVGCLVSGRLIGAIEAEQTEDGETVRNDRLIAVPSASHQHRDIQGLNDLSSAVLEEIEHFFASYNDFKGKTFHPVGRSGPERARRLVEGAMLLR